MYLRSLIFFYCEIILENFKEVSDVYRHVNKIHTVQEKKTPTSVPFDTCTLSSNQMPIRLSAPRFGDTRANTEYKAAESPFHC